MMMASDSGGFHRLVLTTLVVTTIVFFGLASYFPWLVSTNFALGVATGLLSLGTLNWMVSGLAGESSGRPARGLWAVGALHLAKYALIALGLYALFAAGWAHAPALAAGFTLPTLVLCLKEAGRRLNARLGIREGQASEVEETIEGSPGVNS
jgi:hypothetical protein